MKDFQEKYITTDNEFHIILHELAHFEHYKNNEKLFQNKVKFMDKELIRKIEDAVSRLASLNSWELVAEIKVGLLHGKNYPEEIMKIYYEYRGD